MPQQLPALPVQTAESLYRSVRLIRRVEEAIAEIYPGDQIKSPVHLAIGQEHISAAVCELLDKEDWAGGSYRSHALYLAKGGNLKALMAEMYGKATGCCRGKGGSMHIIDLDAGVMGTSAVVGTQLPVVTGYGLAMQMAGKGQVVACFFGDGATEEGCFYESLNFAALKKLPVLYICENNGLAIHEPIEKRRARPDSICEIANALGVPAMRIEDGSTEALYHQADSLMDGLRKGEGPALIEVMTCRWYQHVGPNQDFDQGYRSADDARPWMENDEMLRMRALLPAGRAEAIEAKIETEIAEAIAFAEQSPVPESGELYTHVFA